MKDFIWGDVVHVVDDATFEVRVTYQPSLNETAYEHWERVRVVDQEPPEQQNLSDVPADQLYVGKRLLLKVLNRESDDTLNCELDLAI